MTDWDAVTATEIEDLSNGDKMVHYIVKKSGSWVADFSVTYKPYQGNGRVFINYGTDGYRVGGGALIDTEPNPLLLDTAARAASERGPEAFKQLNR